MTGAVAIVGMACLFPGAQDVDAYWRNILDGVDAVTDPPPDAWDTDVYYDPDSTDPDKVYCKRGGYLGELATFDPLEYGIPPVSVGGEPDQWLALRLAADALADAGATDLPDAIRARTAVVLGKGTYLNGGNAIAVQRGLIVEQTLDVIRRVVPGTSPEEIERLRAEMKGALPPMSAETVPGLIPNIVVGRIANRLDLMGPTYTVDAACASSLVAVQLAMRDLLDGECDLAIAGGSQVWLPVPTLNVFCRLGALSHRQQIRPFDEAADGTLLGEGIGMIVLKRAMDADRDGDRVYALIRGVGVATDGRGASVMAPRVEGEELALRRAYKTAGVSPATIGLLEAHGTGTPVGDAVELEALGRVFGGRDGELPRCALGTVKSMISHTIPASGIAGIIKLALALHHRVLPPTLLATRPNPKLGFDTSPFYLNAETRPWIHGRAEPRRAGINAFGFGGINAHAVLEEAPGGEPTRRDHLPPWDSEVCVLEAETPEALADQAAQLAVALAAHPPYTLTELAAGLARRIGTVERPVRLAVVAESLDDLRTKLERAVERLPSPRRGRIKDVSGIYYAADPLARVGKVAVLFGGEGSQYPGMLADLCLHFPEAREVFDRMDRIYAGHPRGFVTSDWIFPRPSFSDAERDAATDRLMRLDVAVESVLTANHALFAVLRSLGLHADAVVGHSTGEFSAAHAAGVLQLDGDERLGDFCLGMHRAYAGAESRADLPRAVLLAVAAGREQVEAIAAEAGGDLFVAMDNCPHQVVLVGTPDAADRARATLERDNLIHEQLPYDRAVHTPLFAPFADDLRGVFAEVGIGPAQVPLYSCTTAARYPEAEADIRALLVEHWTHPVLFRPTIEALYDDGIRVFVESGPRGNLTAFVEDVLRGRDVVAVAADLQRRSGTMQLNHLVGLLTAHGVALDLGRLFAGRAAGDIDWDAPPTADSLAGGTRLSLAMPWPMLRLPQQHAAVNEAPLAPGAPPPLRLPPAGAPMQAPVLAPAGDATSVLEEHFATMERFLSTNAEIMEAFLAPPAAPVLLDGVIELAESELTARWTLDADDPLLGDHRLGGALVVVPLALSIEALAEAAASLVPGGVVTGLREVRAHRWLAVDDGPFHVEIKARRIDDEQVAVVLHERDSPAPVVEGIVVLGTHYPPAPMPLADPADARRSGLDPERLYADVMFHGPRWQAVAAVEATGPAGARALLRKLPSPRFLLDPITLDAAGQLIGFWTAERFERGRIVFPFRLAALDVYAPPAAAGEEATCAAAITLSGDQLVRSDIDVRGTDGRPWMRLTGWEDKRFDVPAALEALIRPSGGSLSTRCALPGAAHLHAHRIDIDFVSDRALWLRVWAQQVLTPAEREQFRALRVPEQRRLQWLAARTAAKEAVEAVTGMPARSVEIDTEPGGRPVVRGNGAAISLAHTDGVALALAAPAGRVGVDVERLVPTPAGFAEGAFGPGELELLPAAAYDEWLLRAWCAKEAVAKALGNGLGGRPQALPVTAVDVSTGRVTITAEDEQLVATTSVQGDLVIATTQCERGGP